MNAFLIWLFGAGVAQGLFLIVALLGIKVRNVTAKNLLIAIVVTTTLMLGGVFFDLLGFDLQPGAGLAIEFAFGPCMLLFARAITKPGFVMTWRDLLHFIPLATALVLIVFIYVGSGTNSIDQTGPAYRTLITVWILLKIPYFYLYAIPALRLLRENLTDAAGRERRHIVWIRRWLLASCLIVGVMYLDLTLLMLGVTVFPEPDFIGGILLASVAFAIAYFALVSQRVLQSGGPPRQTDMDPRAVTDLANRIDAYIDDEQPYLDPEFSLQDLAQAVSKNVESVAEALHFRHRTTFKELVNARRLAAFTELVTAPSNRQRSILELSYAAGFNSKATFYRLFRAEKGVSPQAYRSSQGSN